VDDDTWDDDTDEARDDGTHVPPSPAPWRTLGERLDAQARRRVTAREPRPLWIGPFTALAQHVAALGNVVGDRFERVELAMPADPETSGPATAQTAPGAIGRRAPARLTAGDRDMASGDAAAEAGGRRTGARPSVAGIPATGDASPHARTTGRPRARHEPADERASDVAARPLPPTARSRLRGLAGPAVDAMRVHDGPASDALARAAGADAVTVGRDVHLREGRYAPHRDRGLALLAHEATHVAAALDPGPAWSRATGADEEERHARHVERLILGTAAPAPAATSRAPSPGPSGSPAPAQWPSAPAPSVAAPAPTAAPGARTAATDRDLGATAVGPDLESLRRGVVADVMRQIRTEFERGG
jgi:hypothetical protein